MFVTFLVMLAIEISLFIDKPNARIFAVTILAVGLVLRGPGRGADAAQTADCGRAAAPRRPLRISPRLSLATANARERGEPVLCAVRGIGRTLDFAIEDARRGDSPLYLLFIREQPVVTPEDRKRKWMDDPEALEIFTYAADKADGHTVLPCYAVSDAVPDTIVDIAATVGTSRVILGSPRRASFATLLRGNLIRQVATLLPDDIHLLVYA